LVGVTAKTDSGTGTKYREGGVMKCLPAWVRSLKKLQTLSNGLERKREGKTMYLKKKRGHNSLCSECSLNG